MLVILIPLWWSFLYCCVSHSFTSQRPVYYCHSHYPASRFYTIVSVVRMILCLSLFYCRVSHSRSIVPVTTECLKKTLSLCIKPIIKDQMSLIITVQLISFRVLFRFRRSNGKEAFKIFSEVSLDHFSDKRLFGLHLPFKKKVLNTNVYR